MDERNARLLQLIEQDILANRLILPSLPEVALRVREMSSAEDADLAKLEKEIAKDAAIAARILKVANSSAMQRGKPLSSLKQAISRLGLNLVRSLVTQLAILQTMQSCDDKERLRGFVASGLRISALCHSLSAHQPHLDREQAALAGLLHDIGKLPLRKFLNRQAGLCDNEALCRHIEQELHPQVGALMLRHWNFPEELIQATAEHEEMLRDSGALPDYADVVIAANLLHYGTEKGRYAHLAEQAIPAMTKCLPEAAQDRLEHSVEQRMAMSLSMISA